MHNEVPWNKQMVVRVRSERHREQDKRRMIHLHVHQNNEKILISPFYVAAHEAVRVDEAHMSSQESLEPL